jgi:hypothetical protein
MHPEEDAQGVCAKNATKLVAIVVVYAGKSNHPFMAGDVFAVTSQEDISEAFSTLAGPILSDGMRIVSQLVIVVPDELVARVCHVGS